MARAGAALRDVVESLGSRPGRVALALLALFTVAVALAVLAGVLRGLDLRAAGVVEDFGLDSFALLPMATSGKWRTLPTEAVDRRRAASPRLRTAAVRAGRASTRNGDVQFQVAQVDPALARIRPFP